MATVSKYDDTIDSRDIIERIKELTDERDFLKDAAEESRKELDEQKKLIEAKTEITLEEGDILATEETGDEIALLEWEENYGDELKALEELEHEAEGYADDWQYGATLVRDSYFKDYAQEFAEDIGAIKKGQEWPYTCIDWERAAEELQQDYTSVDFDGVTYWVR